MKNNFKSDLPEAFKVIWFGFSIFTLTIILTSVFFPETLLNISPECLSKKLNGTECFMCGTTRAFTEAGSGDFAGGYRLNRFSLFVYFSFILNGIMFFAFIINKLIVKFKHRRKDERKKVVIQKSFTKI